ncbi:hypothetical protein PM082_016973 [Marasmius tenuissimus]|nr:hypothetical protein PM082_016973 [Marasmius tenuissimus]
MLSRPEAVSLPDDGKHVQTCLPSSQSGRLQAYMLSLAFRRHFKFAHALQNHCSISSRRRCVCLESSVTDSNLREAGPQGIDVEDISKKNSVDPQKLGRFLRILAVGHIYLQVDQTMSSPIWQSMHSQLDDPSLHVN